MKHNNILHVPNNNLLINKLLFHNIHLYILLFHNIHLYILLFHNIHLYILLFHNIHLYKLILPCMMSIISVKFINLSSPMHDMMK
jgi:hypothetical protein